VEISIHPVVMRGPRWHSGYGAVLQIGRSLVRSQMVSLEFFIDISFPGVDSASNRNEYQGHFPGGKGGRCVRLTTLPLSCAILCRCHEIRES